MSKALRICIALMVFASLATPAFATTAPKAATVALYVNGELEPAEVTAYQGDVIDLSAVTLKQGSSITDEWTGVTSSSATVLNTATGNYEAAATLDTAGLSAGDHEVTYSVVMAAGKSQVTFVGGKKTTVNVVESTIAVKRITVRILSVTERYSQGSKPALTGYEAEATAQALLSDGTVVNIGDVDFNYNKFADDAAVTVNVEVDGEIQTFVLDVPFVTETPTDVVFNDPVVVTE